MNAAPRSTRRDFLQGKAAAVALAEVAWSGEPAELPAPVQESYLVKLSRRAMACQFEIFLNAGQYPAATEAAVATLDLVDALEDQLTVFREHSEISRLNRQAATGPVVVEPRLFALLEQAVRTFAQTAGAYDITTAPLSRAWGFLARAGAVPNGETLAAARELVGSQFLELAAADCSVRFLKPGVEINLGSIGKGYALDRCTELLEAAEVHDFLLHGGNSSVLARGSAGDADDAGGWMVGVRHPLRPQRRFGQLRLRDRALATSGSGTQFFVHDGQRYGHLLDPRSGWPATGVLSASAIAPTAAEADALSTAFYVMGPAAVLEYCRLHTEIGAVILCPGEREGSLVQHVFGIGERDWKELEAS